MKRTFRRMALCVAVLSLATFILADEKKPEAGPVTGTWECVSHGGAFGDLAFTLALEQKGEQVIGSISSDMGSAEITSGSFKDQVLEVKVVAPEFTYTLTGKLESEKLAGEWTLGDAGSGTWEGKKSAPATP